jgi:hypothetical protein
LALAQLHKGEVMLLEPFLVERNRILIELDVTAAMRDMPGATREIAEIALHKARYICSAIPPEFRHASREWLFQRGYVNGLLPAGDLPS